MSCNCKNKDIPSIRKGNDIEIKWAIYTGSGINMIPYNLEGKPVTAYFKTKYGKIPAKNISVTGHIVEFFFYGKDQNYIGPYSIELIENEGNIGMHTVDECKAFELVKCTCEADGAGGEGLVSVTSLEFRTSMQVGVSGSNIIVDTELSFLSENPVQNKVITKAINELSEKVDSLRPSEGEDVIYESSIEDKTLEMPSAVGGLGKGTTVQSLEGKTFSQMFDDILFPAVNPTFSAPSASLQFKNYSSTKEVGSDAPTASNFTTGYNAGAITLNGVKQNDRGGELDSDNSFIYVNGDATNKTLPSKVSLGSTTYKYRAAYAEGAQPKDNKGNDYGSPLASGYVDSPAVTLNGTYPWFASTASASAENPVAKQSLVAWNATAGSMSTGNFELQPSGTLPQVFKLPRKISTLQMLNTVSNKMETIGLGDYNETTETISIGGVDVTYYVYTYKGAARGSVTLLAKF